MDYQLVLQIAGDSLPHYDVMIEVEGRLIEAIGDVGEVDGHDIGSGEANIFILTTRPEAAFLRAKVVLEDLDLIDHIKAAYRLTAGETYTVIWPSDSRSQFSVT